MHPGREHRAEKSVLFMGIKPDGYVCERCELYDNDDLKPLGRVLFCNGGEP
jgi:hypothetical protein